MYIRYTVYLADESTIGHHGKAETSAYGVCFPCAAILAIDGHHIDDEIILTIDERLHCDRCSGEIPEGAK